MRFSHDEKEQMQPTINLSWE